jgi:hypothetical protein
MPGPQERRTRFAICAINYRRQTDREPEIEMVPVGLMFNVDPYEMLIPASDPEEA